MRMEFSNEWVLSGKVIDGGKYNSLTETISGVQIMGFKAEEFALLGDDATLFIK